MNWLIYALISVVSLSVSNVLQRVLMKDDKSDAYAYSVVTQFFCAAITGLFAVWKGFTLPPITQLPLNFLLMAALYGLGTVFIFKALKMIEASEVTIITTTRSIVTIISALIVLHETFNLSKIIGTTLILGAVFFISKTKSTNLKFNKGVLWAFAMALCYGLAVTNDTFILRHMTNVYAYTSISFLLPGLFLLIINPGTVKKLGFLSQTRVLRNMFLMTLLYSTAAIAFFSALGAGANASQIGPINQSSVILTVLLAAIFLKERDVLWKKLLSTLLVFFGVILLK
jgi:bacterial/archaeal transporter family protein